MGNRFTKAEQERLAASSALLIGAGGLGSPIAYQLAAAGVGRIGLCDMDRVDLSNLQRQILHFTEDIERLKVESGAAKIRALNPAICVQAHPVALTAANAVELFSGYDLIFDGSDNFATRYLVNDACLLTGKPHVHGSIFQFDGQVTLFGSGGAPCYRCIYPSPPPPGTVPSCAQAGVIGVLPGFIGSLMAMEGLKILVRRGQSLTGRLLIYSSLQMELTEVRIPRAPSCPACGANSSLNGLIDYEAFCGGVGQ